MCAGVWGTCLKHQSPESIGCGKSGLLEISRGFNLLFSVLREYIEKTQEIPIFEHSFACQDCFLSNYCIVAPVVCMCL